jgi:hypothetical protein
MSPRSIITGPLRRCRALLAGAAALGLLLGVAGCIGPLADLGEPHPPTAGNLCCYGYDPARLGRLAGTTPTVISGGNTLILGHDFQARLVAVATSRGLSQDQAEKVQWAYAGSIARPGDGAELLLALVRLVRVSGSPAADDTSAGTATITVTRPGARQGLPLYPSLALLHGLGTNPAKTTSVVVALVVPARAQVLMCPPDGLDNPRLDLRTGRLAPTPPGVRGCYGPVPSPVTASPTG